MKGILFKRVSRNIKLSRNEKNRIQSKEKDKDSISMNSYLIIKFEGFKTSYMIVRISELYMKNTIYRNHLIKQCSTVTKILKKLIIAQNNLVRQLYLTVQTLAILI